MLNVSHYQLLVIDYYQFYSVVIEKMNISNDIFRALKYKENREDLINKKKSSHLFFTIYKGIFVQYIITYNIR
jgi:hypothetical protein